MIRFIGSGSDLRSLLDEPLVLTHDQLRLDLFHGVQGHADDDQDRRSPQVHVLGWYWVSAVARSGMSTVTPPRKSAPANVMRVIVRSRYCAVATPGRIPGMKAACFLR